MIFSPDGVMALLLLAGELMQGEPMVESSSDLVLFVGRFHPFLVHLPIGMLLLAILFEFASLFERHSQLSHAVPFALLLGLLSSVVAAVTGYLLSSAGGYGEQALWLHRLFGFAVVLLSFAAYLLRITLYKQKSFRRLFRATLLLLACILVAAGHYGGSLTHGSDYLFRYMPEELRSMIGVEIFTDEEEIALIEDLDSALVYEDVIAPIIRTRCENCHNPDRREADLLLTSFGSLMQGGESGPAVVVRNADESELYRRLILPPRDDERMPPRGRRQLSHDQIRLIAWWIDQGAPTGEPVTRLEADGDIAGILERLTVAGQSFFDRTEVLPADEASLVRAQEQGFRLSLVVEDRFFLQVGVAASVRRVGTEELELLQPLAEQITWLDLSRVELDNLEPDALSQFRNLTRLNLRQTNAGDSTMIGVGSLQHLEYLNLYGTRVSDAGLRELESLMNLKSLYLWQTDVNRDAVERLLESIPGLYVNLGAEAVRSPEVAVESGE